jgi:sulfite reductase (ferredoxin)
MASDAQKPGESPPNRLEEIKAQSDFLRGRIIAELADATDRFSEETAQLLRFHGIYQQDDRDRRYQLGDPFRKPENVPQFMVRTTTPGGRLTSDQWLAYLDLCETLGDGTLRLTSRQNVQLYGVRKRDLRAVLRRIYQLGLTTLGSCGDVRRNVACCPAPYRADPVHGQMQDLAGRLYEELGPRIDAYRQIWLEEGPPGGPAASLPSDAAEPLYGPTYLPRKFKVAVGLPGDNCVDLYTQDVGLLAVCEDFNVVGYNVLVGGGMGVAPERSDTFPTLAQPMGMAWAGQAIDVVRTVMMVYRDFGDRSDRQRARLRFLLADWGMERFKAEVERRLGYALAPSRPIEVWDTDDHLGWHEQGDGRWFCGLFVENGRVLDRNGPQLKSALREICERYRPAIYVTPGQSLILGDVAWEDRVGVDDLLHRHGVKSAGEISNLRRWSIACVSLPTCPAAVTESERALPEIVDHLERELARLGLAHEVFDLRMTGCANGCARAYLADVGILGRSPGRYALYLGGRRIGNRLGFLYRDGIPLEQVVTTLLPVLAYFKLFHDAGETLGDFCHRKGRDDLIENASAI